MATKTLGTNGTNTLTAINFQKSVSAADMATIVQAIKGDNGIRIKPGAFSSQGLLYLPGDRGIIQVQPGDWVGVDHYGWPIVVSKNSIADGSTSWTHS